MQVAMPDENFIDNEPEPVRSGQRRVTISFDESAGKIEEIRILINNPPTAQSGRILTEILPKWIEQFLSKNADYANSKFNASELLGSKGQFAEIWRKVGKLYGPMWEGTELNHEQVDEILEDFAGHVFLSLLFMKDNK